MRYFCKEVPTAKAKYDIMCGLKTETMQHAATVSRIWDIRASPNNGERKR